MRNSFAEEVTRLADNYPDLLLLSGDIGNRLFNPFKEKFPERFFNCGVAEQNLIGTAAGLAMAGFKPVVYTITPFVTSRCYEQIKVDICYHNLPVVLVGTGSGLCYANLGYTHYSLEDIAILKPLPNIKIFAPCDPLEAKICLREALLERSPVYIRLGKKGEKTVHSPSSLAGFQPGRATLLRKGEGVCFLAVGSVAELCIKTAEEIEKELGVSCSVYSFHLVKPLDTATLNEVFNAYKVVVSVEEHNEESGAGASISHWLAKKRGGFKGARFIPFGAASLAPKHCGDREFIRNYLGLGGEGIFSIIKEELQKGG